MVKKKTESLSDIAQILSAGLTKAATRPDITGYVPHAKQKIFHTSEKKGKLYIGGNRSGKTVGGVIEDLWWMEGNHPFRETPPPPIRARLVCVDYPNGWTKIIKPVLQQWVRPSSLIDGSWEASWSEREKKLTLANGSFLEIMNYEQQLDAFAGSSRHLIHFDEEPPKAIWIENRMRLMDTGGSWHITMTPVEGMTWVFDDIYEPATLGLSDKIDVIEVDVEENIYLSSVEIEDALAGLDENEKKARKSGKFVQIGGLIFKQFNADIHVLAPPRGIPPGWRVAGSIDHGFNHPTAVMWHMISPKDTVVTFKEHYRSEFTIQQHVQRIREIEAEIKALGYHGDILYWCDPAMRQRGAVTGNSVQLEYQMRGINVVPSNNDVATGLARMLGYQNHGRWFITEECPNLLREMRRYRWKTRESRKLQEKHGAYDEPHKKDDDAMDSSRYFFMSLPELKPTIQVAENVRSKNEEIAKMLQAATPRNLYVPQLDRNLLRPNYEQFKVSTDEFMGGEW